MTYTSYTSYIHIQSNKIFFQYYFDVGILCYPTDLAIRSTSKQAERARALTEWPPAFFPPAENFRTKTDRQHQPKLFFLPNCPLLNSRLLSFCLFIWLLISFIYWRLGPFALKLLEVLVSFVIENLFSPPNLAPPFSILCTVKNPCQLS